MLGKLIELQLLHLLLLTPVKIFRSCLSQPSRSRLSWILLKTFCQKIFRRKTEWNWLKVSLFLCFSEFLPLKRVFRVCTRWVGCQRWMISHIRFICHVGEPVRKPISYNCASFTTPFQSAHLTHSFPDDMKFFCKPFFYENEYDLARSWKQDPRCFPERRLISVFPGQPT